MGAAPKDPTGVACAGVPRKGPRPNDAMPARATHTAPQKPDMQGDPIVTLELNARSGFHSDMARKTGSHAEQTGPRVRDAALRLFAQYGYAAVSMRQIAREVGVQAGALYTYTPDKQALLFDLMRGHMLELLDALASQPQPDDPLEALQGFVRFHIGHHLDRDDAVFVSYMELRNLSPENFATVEGYRRRYEAALETILSRGREADLLHVPDVRIATMAIIAMLTGVNTWYRDGGRLSRDAIADMYWDMVRGMVGADQTARQHARA